MVEHLKVLIKLQIDFIMFFFFTDLKWYYISHEERNLLSQLYFMVSDKISYVRSCLKLHEQGLLFPFQVRTVL